MKFDQLVENTAKTQNLKRIRIKFDPLNKEHDAFKAYAGYEGYVLQECGGSVSIVVMQPAQDMNPMVELPASMVAAPVNNSLQGLKAFILQKLGAPAGEMIANLADIVAIETLLKDNGLNDMHIKDLYKEYILGNEQI
jgi:hypothetical protein